MRVRYYVLRIAVICLFINPRIQPFSSQAFAAVDVFSGEQLQISVQTRKSHYAVGEEVDLTISLHNLGGEDKMLYAGMMLGNGTQLWEALQCRVVGQHHQVIPVIMHWRVPGVAGSLTLFGIPLKADATYTLQVTAKDYYFDLGGGGPGRFSEHLPAGSYQIACDYATGHEGRKRRDEYWEIEAKSAPYNFEVGDSR